MSKTTIITYQVLVSLVLMILTGCGTIASNRTGVKRIVSTPTGANWTIYDKYNIPVMDSLNAEISGITPQSIRWKSGYDSVKFDMRGYPSQTIRPRKTEKNNAILGNLVWIAAGGIVSLVDSSSGGDKKSFIGPGNSSALYALFWIGGVGVVGFITDLATGGYRKYPDHITANLGMPANTPNQTQTNKPENNSVSSLQGIEEALSEAIQLAFRDIAGSSRIAVFSISTADNTLRDYVLNETEVRLFNQGFRIVDRTHLETIRREQGLQYSGEVDDVTSVNIGKLAGARYIVTGSVDGTGMLRRLRLKVLDTETAEVVGLASVRF